MFQHRDQHWPWLVRFIGLPTSRWFTEVRTTVLTVTGVKNHPVCKKTKQLLIFFNAPVFQIYNTEEDK